MAKAEYDTFKGDDEKVYTTDDALDAIGTGRFQFAVLGVCGWLWMADAIEILMITLLGPILECEWNLLPWQQASINTAVLTGLLIGSLFLGPMADLYGRKSTLVFSCIFATLYGLMSSTAPNFVFFMLLRAATGIFIGGTMHSVNYCAEMFPPNFRGKLVPPTVSMFAVGTILTVVLAMVAVDSVGWRWWIAMCSSPLLIGIFLTLLLPESPRYTVSVGKTEDAMKVLRMIADTNRGTLLEGRLQPDHLGKSHADIRELLTPELRRTFFQMLLGWFLFAFTYYGVAIFSTDLIRLDSLCVSQEEINPAEYKSSYCQLECQRLTTSDYVQIIIVNVGDILIVPVSILLVETIGRRYTLSLSHLSHALALLPLVLFCFVYQVYYW